MVSLLQKTLHSNLCQVLILQKMTQLSNQGQGGVQTREGGAAAMQGDLSGGSKPAQADGGAPDSRKSPPKASPSLKSVEEKDLLLEAER